MNPLRRRLCALLLAAPLAAAPAAVLAAEEKKKGGGLSYIQLSPLSGTVTRPYGKRGVLTVEVGLDIPNGALRNKANLILPRLRANYVSIIESYAAGLGIDAVPNADYIAVVLQRSTDQALGQPGAKLLIGSILVS